jgi:RHS repeat-associated protein
LCPPNIYDERLYYTTDANFNVTCLTDKNGDEVERYVYNPYGEVETVYSDNWSTTVAWSASKKNPIRYCGYFYDNETGLYHVRNRYYLPYFGWITRDPAGYADGMSLYEYCRSGPLGATDAMGLCTAPGQAGPDAEGDGSNTAKEVLPPWKQPGYKGGDNGVPAREPPPVGPWQPKNEGPAAWAA